MSTLRIGNEERALSDADANWINQQINGLRRDSRSVCVMLLMNQGDINIRLQTSGCAVAGGGGSRAPNQREREVLDLWAKHHLDRDSFAGGDVVSFVKQLARLA